VICISLGCSILLFFNSQDIKCTQIVSEYIREKNEELKQANQLAAERSWIQEGSILTNATVDFGMVAKKVVSKAFYTHVFSFLIPVSLAPDSFRSLSSNRFV
jgi:hypothetical protein